MIMIAGLLCACGQKIEAPARRNLAPAVFDITGSWRSAPFETQLGDATDVVCFKQNGAMTDVLTAQGATMALHGRYSIRGSVLVYIWSTGSKETVHFLVNDNVLSITDEAGKTRRYKRSSRSC